MLAEENSLYHVLRSTMDTIRYVEFGLLCMILVTPVVAT
jgi:hypothetical protein